MVSLLARVDHSTKVTKAALRVTLGLCAVLVLLDTLVTFPWRLAALVQIFRLCQ
jgi:hypothetical protein